MEKNARIYIAGHRGLVGSALFRKLSQDGYTNLITLSSLVLDLTQQAEVERFFTEYRPDYVFLSAGQVGGIKANLQYPASFFYVNAMMANNVIHSALQHKVKKLLYLGSACSYPPTADQPLSEDALLEGKFDPSHEAYALAKLAGVKMCQFYRQQYDADFIAAMPASVYGPNDNFDLVDGHLIPCLIRKFHEAKLLHQPSVSLWGSGKAYRELMFADDLADGLVFLMHHYDQPEPINIGAGQDYTVREYAEMVREIVGYTGPVVFDETEPEGAPRKLLDSTRINALGWQAQTPLKEGLASVYRWFQHNYAEIAAD
jgi:GDP-L-fucose synthase